MTINKFVNETAKEVLAGNIHPRYLDELCEWVANDDLPFAEFLALIKLYTEGSKVVEAVDNIRRLVPSNMFMDIVSYRNHHSMDSQHEWEAMAALCSTWVSKLLGEPVSTITNPAFVSAAACNLCAVIADRVTEDIEASVYFSESDCAFTTEKEFVL